MRRWSSLSWPGSLASRPRRRPSVTAVGAQPGASNRAIADAAGVEDQGQISKLLRRLESLGLIQNTGRGHSKGEPNVWTLTPRGSEVEQAIRAQTG